MADDFQSIFEVLKSLLAKYENQLSVKVDQPGEYTLETRSPSPFPQHKGQPLFFAGLRAGKAYVSFHFMPIYMCPPLNSQITPELKKRMQGKACFNFKTLPNAELKADLKRLTDAALKLWKEKKWL